VFAKETVLLKHFVVMEWNGEDYSDCVEEAIAVFPTLKEAVEFITTHPEVKRWTGEIIPRDQSHWIAEFAPTQRETLLYSAAVDRVRVRD
jgi:hypothetical protein